MQPIACCTLRGSVRCPSCKKNFEPKASKYAPFCSERCKLIDLGRWLEGDYRVPGEPAPLPEERPGEDDEDES